MRVRPFYSKVIFQTLSAKEQPVDDLLEFHIDLIADVQGDADAFELLNVDAFFEKTGELLAEAGEIESPNRAYHEGSYGRSVVQIDGYGGDPIDAEGVLSLIICDFDLQEEIRVFNKDGVLRLARRLSKFLTASLQYEFRNILEESSTGYGVADLIASRWDAVEKVKLIIITNADFRARADASEYDDLDGRQVTLSVWDLKRLKQYMEQGQSRADLTIDFQNDFGGAIPLLPASGSSASLDSYLAVMPGKQLASVYDKWGPRLLEANVRSFLQARGKVNKGIRKTIRDEPNMFFPYNNGLSVTADCIKVANSADGIVMVSADNLQIVNGGQTTASLHAVRKTCVEQLEEVYVQVKLTVVPKNETESVVPRISEYANSQNKVNASDFFSNHPFHIRTEELSRKVLVRGEGRYRDTRWFYERVRGQYADERGRRTIAERKKFDAEFPRTQFLSKTDLAKYENTWLKIPHIVSLGAQKNFAEFAKNIGKIWGTEGTKFNELWFRRLVAKAIIFRTMEKLVSAAEWYEGGYRANIVTYAIAKMVHDAEEQSSVLDLDSVWNKQKASKDFQLIMQAAATEAKDVITNPVTTAVRNYGEWAKMQACWEMLRKRTVEYPAALDSILISEEADNVAVRESRSVSSIDASVNAEIEVHELGKPFWVESRNWATERGLLSPKEIHVLEICAAIPDRMPTDKQCVVAMKALSKLKNEGFTPQTGSSHG